MESLPWSQRLGPIAISQGSDLVAGSTAPIRPCVERLVKEAVKIGERVERFVEKL